MPALSMYATLAAGSGNQTPLVIGSAVIILIAAIAAAISLKKS